MQGLTPDLFRLVVLWHELIESTVTDPNSPDNRFILWQRNGAEITLGLLIQSLEQTLCKKYEEIMKTIIFFDKYTFAEARITALRQKPGFLP